MPAPGKNKIKKSDYIWSNPNTKKGHECYVRFDDRGNGWCCDYGQAWINLKFHQDVNTAIEEMRNITEIITGKKKIKTGMYEVVG